MFRGLIEDYPELPEPYNNLAVIYAQQGEYDSARDRARDRDPHRAQLGGRARESRRHLRAPRRRRVRSRREARSRQQDRAGEAHAGARSVRARARRPSRSPRPCFRLSSVQFTSRSKPDVAPSVPDRRHRRCRCGFALPALAANPQVEFDTTAGKIRVELYPDAAPKTVANFLDYVKASTTTARSSTA